MFELEEVFLILSLFLSSLSLLPSSLLSVFASAMIWRLIRVSVINKPSESDGKTTLFIVSISISISISIGINSRRTNASDE